MSEINFNSSMKEVIKFLKALELFKSNGIKVINKDDVSSEFKKACQHQDYFNLYNVAISNNDYDILLKDDSILQFSFKFDGVNTPQIRYAFLQNPRNYRSYEEFLETLRESGIISDETNDGIGDLLHNEYNQYLTEQGVNESATAIRYDVDKKSYKALIHSTAHFHIGHGNNLRIPCKTILSPMKFAIFITKHVYYKNWKKQFEEADNLIVKALQTAKGSCLILNSGAWNADLEQKELFMS